MRSSTLRISRLALMTAILCITAPLEIPTGTVPVTLQTFFVALAGAFLGPRDGFFAALAYLLLGAVGMPVFSGWSGGFGMLMGPTGGFLMAFPLLALFCGFARKRAFPFQALSALLGLLLLDLSGVLHLMRVAGLSLPAALFAGVWPFLLKDIVCVLLSILCARKLAHRLRI